MAQSKKRKKTNSVNGRAIINLLIGLGFLSIILLVTMISAPKSTGNQGIVPSPSAREEDQTDQTGEDGKSTTTAVVKAVDTENNQIQLYDINRKELIGLSYSGGTNITDKYGQIISMNQIVTGSMVDVVYREDKAKLTDMSISAKAWEYVGVSNLSIDRDAKVMKIVDRKYKYESDLLILDGTEFIPVTDLAEQDELTIRGYNETIWSITVTRGHGIVILKDYENFLGDNITIGYEAMQQIAEGLEITVREGNFNLTVENKSYSATKNITVYRNKITYVSLGDLGPDVSATGQITFEITPFGADLYIDGTLASYANPVELDYGKHQIKVSLGGYSSYEGTLSVDSPGKTVNIDLPENSSKNNASVTETNTSAGADASTSGTDDTGTVIDHTSASAQDTPADYSDIDADDIDEDHKIYVQEPVGTSVYIDGNYMCTAPGSFKKITGTHVITFIKDGYETKSYTIEISDDHLDTYLTFPNLEAEAD